MLSNTIHHGLSNKAWAFNCTQSERVSERAVKPALKGLGHAIWGNFSTDQIVKELTKISK